MSGPVEIPGRVLGPGTYIFRLVHPSYSPDAVQIIDRHTSQVEGLFLTLPAYRAKATGKTIVKLQRPNSGYAVPEIKKWFYPGNNVGHTFIYSPAAREFMSSLRQQTHSAKG
ncbi:MAG TPA: hypothetical protein VNJ12_10485 [Candidatus Dormibacteraeota bacterium]|nr:hypothetical protein [Candidatus Dormibacteraeota bacterium]